MNEQLIQPTITPVCGGRSVSIEEMMSLLESGHEIAAADAGPTCFVEVVESYFGRVAETHGFDAHGNAVVEVWKGTRRTIIQQTSRFPLAGFAYKAV